MTRSQHLADTERRDPAIVVVVLNSHTALGAPSEWDRLDRLFRGWKPTSPWPRHAARICR
jgi:hypothetical protein